MNRKILILAFIVSFVLITSVWASKKKGSLSGETKLVKSEVIKECVGLPHGELIGCIYQKMKMHEATKQPKPYSDQLKRVQIKGVPNRASKLKNPFPVNPESLARGKVFYTQNCISCHGALGKGDGPVLKELNITGPDLTTPFLQNVQDGDFLIKISEGGWPMPAFGLQTEWNEEDLWHVINYVRSLSSSN